MDARPRGRPFLVRALYWFTGRGSVFFFILSLLVLALYLLGNFQQFLDSTQLFLLSLLRLSLIAELLLCPIYFVMVFLMGRQRRFAGRLVLCVLSAAFSAAMLLAAGFLSVWF